MESRSYIREVKSQKRMIKKNLKKEKKKKKKITGRCAFSVALLDG